MQCTATLYRAYLPWISLKFNTLQPFPAIAPSFPVPIVKWENMTRGEGERMYHNLRTSFAVSEPCPLHHWVKETVTVLCKEY